MLVRPTRLAAAAALVILAAVSLSWGCARQPPEGSASRGSEAIGGAEILWDTWGVPHLFAEESTDLFYAQGWAQARNHGDLILRLYGQARGRAAEYWGERFLDSDRWLRTMGVPARGEEWYRRQSPRAKGFLDAFARGINDYAAAHPERIADEVAGVLPVTAADVLAHYQHVIHFTFVVNRYEAAGAGRRLGAGPAAGSNAWAVSPSRSASGNALLVANPHLPWDGLFLFFEVQMTSPEIDAYGVTLVGNPFLGIAFNDHLGWTHTVNTHDGADLYELELAEGGYLYDGAVEPFEEERQTLEVRRDDGTFEERELLIRRSIHGPVVAAGGEKALALRVVGLEEAGIVDQYWDMARATDLESFEAALAELQMPLFTVMYADRDGHILHLFGGRTPVRPEGSWSWSGIVPGSTSATLWTETHPYEELPRVLDPPSGWLQNANDPPWTTTFPRALDPDAFPAYMAPRSMSARAQRSAKLVSSDESLTLDELVVLKHDTRVELADRLLDDLARAVAAHGTERAKRALAVLEAWDRRTDAESRGAVLFAAWAEELGRRGSGAFAAPWSPARPLETPDGFAPPAPAAALLASAAAEVESAHGALDVAWGEVFRLRRDGVDLPGNGGPGGLGIFRVVGYGPSPAGGYQAGQGDSWVACVEFSDPVDARVLLSYGNASQPGSPHRADQLEMFSKRELRPALRARAAIEAQLEEREVLTTQLGP